MPIQVLGKGGRIAGGVLVGLFALQTCGWLFFDVGELGAAGAWDLWIGGTDASGADAVVTALVLAFLALTNLAWNGYLVLDGGIGFWGDMFTGSGTVASVLAVPPAMRWLMLAALCGAGAILAGTRSVAARGFTLGAALLLVPESVLTAVWYLDRGMLFELGNSGAAGVASRLQTFVTLVGGIAVLVLMSRAGTPVDVQGVAGPQHAPAGPFPGQQQGPGGWQQGWGQPAPGGPVPPQQPPVSPAWGPQPGQPAPARHPQPYAPQPGPAQPQQPPAGYGYPQPPGPQPPAPRGGFGPPPQV